ncbi:MAG: M48 family metalloprotease [Gammaproteobacteria bacterium]|nr:M48 family metalloprotease [Gammaproteobacteria bacterium]
MHLVMNPAAPLALLRRLLVACVLATVTVPALASPGLTLPDLGSVTLDNMGSAQERALGRAIVNEIRRQGGLVEDPELAEYIQNLGSRLSSSYGGGDFTFFLVKDDSINAFALPGGYIGVHTGLVRRTRTESELASVIAHEIAHVTQKHIARRYQASNASNLKTLGLLLGAIAIAAAGGDSDDVAGTLMLGQGLAIQEQLNFTRAQETEADRVGLNILTRADFDPQGMVNFFQVMQRFERLQSTRRLEFMSTHPLSTTRVIEAAQRVQAMGPVSGRESRTYPLMHARIQALYVAADDQGGQTTVATDGDELATRYLEALRHLERGRARQASDIFSDLKQEAMDRASFHIGHGRALAVAGDKAAALDVLGKARLLFPESVPVALTYAEALETFGETGEAYSFLDNFFNRHSPPVEAIRYLARLASALDMVGKSHYLMSEYYLRTGEGERARIQLQLSLQVENISETERLQYQARLDELEGALAAVRRSSRESENRKQR